jgi:hypothetical protein
MDFHVQHLHSDQIDETPVEVFRLKLAHMLGWVVPGIDVYYSATDHVLMRYVGLSDLRDVGGDNLRADIEFPPADRKASSAHQVDDALRAPLAPCR